MMSTQQIQTALGEGIRAFNNIGSAGNPQSLVEFWASLPVEMRAWLVDNSIDGLTKVRDAHVAQHDATMTRIDGMLAEQQGIDGVDPVEVRFVHPAESVEGDLEPITTDGAGLLALVKDESN